MKIKRNNNRSVKLSSILKFALVGALSAFMVSCATETEEIETLDSVGEANRFSHASLDRGDYKIKNIGSGLYLETEGYKTGSGANIQQWKNNNHKSQIWNIAQVSGNYYQILNKNSNKALDVFENQTGNTGNVIQWENKGTDNQLWTITRDGDKYKITNKNSNKLLEVANFSKSKGGNVQQYQNKNHDFQQWEITAE